MRGFPEKQFRKIPFKVLVGGGAVAAYRANAGKAFQQRGDVIGPFPGDVLVQASGPDAGGHHVPQPHAPAVEQAQAFLIRQGEVEPQQFAHDFPERIARMGVILHLPQGLVPRQGAKHQHGTFRRHGRRKGTFLPRLLNFLHRAGMFRVPSCRSACGPPSCSRPASAGKPATHDGRWKGPG